MNISFKVEILSNPPFSTTEMQFLLSSVNNSRQETCLLISICHVYNVIPIYAKTLVMRLLLYFMRFNVMFLNITLNRNLIRKLSC